MNSPTSLLRGCRALLAGVLAATALGAQAQVSVQSYSTPLATMPGTMKTVDFASVTLANVGNITPTTTLGSSGGAVSTITSGQPNGFTTSYLKVVSGTGSSSGTTQTVTFGGSGTTYVSFLWNIATTSSENRVRFTLSGGSTVTVSNCSGNTSTCVGGYDYGGLLSGLFGLLLPDTESAQSIRFNYKPPTGQTVTKVEFTAFRRTDCTLFILCGNVNGNFRIDNLSFVDPGSTPSSGLHHLEIIGSTSQVVTCETHTYRVRACADAACSTLYTSGVTGNLALTGIGSGISYPSGAGFTIASGSGVSTGTVSVKTTTTGTATVGAGSVAPAPDNNAYCSLGTTGASNAAGACSLTVKSTGLKLSLPDHQSGTSQNLTIKAIKDVFGSCANIGVSATLPLSVTGVFSTVSGVKPLLGGVSLTSGTVTNTLSAVLNILGDATMPFQYNDVGRVQLQAATGNFGLLSGLLSFANLTGNVSFVVAPSSFKIEPVITGSTVKAGRDFTLKISALNSLGNVAGNFGTEVGLGDIALSSTLLKPASRAGGAPNNPALALPDLSFSNGVATLTTSWDEVGTVNIGAALPKYLGSALDVVGSLTSTAGFTNGLRFVPDRFKVTATPGCSSGSVPFTYAGQPFNVAVEAVNAVGDTTLNYDGTQALATDRIAQAVSLGAASGAVGGAFATSGASVAATSFANGQASSTMTYNVTNKLTAPATVVMQAQDTDGVLANGTAIGEVAAKTVKFLSGRIRLSNAFGSEKSSLQMPLQLQYWSGKSWVPATADGCTTAASLPLGAIARANYLDNKGAVASGAAAWTTSPASVTLNAGTGTGYITLAAPAGNKTGSVDVTLDLSSAGANLPWLQLLNQSCGATPCNPTARATFGVYTPESKKTVHVRDVF